MLSGSDGSPGLSTSAIRPSGRSILPHQDLALLTENAFLRQQNADQAARIEERGIDYRLFSDPQNGVAEEYGIVNDLDGMAGISEPRPAVFILNEDRMIQYDWVAQEWPDFPDYDEIEDTLIEL